MLNKLIFSANRRWLGVDESSKLRSSTESKEQRLELELGARERLGILTLLGWDLDTSSYITIFHFARLIHSFAPSRLSNYAGQQKAHSPQGTLFVMQIELQHGTHGTSVPSSSMNPIGNCNQQKYLSLQTKVGLHTRSNDHAFEVDSRIPGFEATLQEFGCCYW